LNSFAKENILSLNYPLLYSKIVFLDAVYDFHQQGFENVINKFTKVLKVDKANSEALYLRARSYLKSSEIKKAITDLKRLKDINYKDAGTLYNSLGK